MKSWESEPSRSSALAGSGRDFAFVAVPKVLSAALQLSINLLLVRYLGPDRAGIVFVCLTAILLSDAVLGSALDVAVVRLATGTHAADAIEVQKAAILMKVLGCVLIAVPILVWAAPLSRLLFHGDGPSHLLPLSVLALFGLLLLRSVQTYFQVSNRFVCYGAADLLHSCIKLGGIAVLLAFHSLTPTSVLTLYVAGPLSVSLAMLATFSRGILSARLSKTAFHRLFDLFKWYAGAATAGSITSRMDLFVVSALAGTRQAGVFSAAQIFAQPFQLLGMYLGIVFAPRILPLWEQGRLLEIYQRFQTVVIAGCVVFYVAAMMGAPVITQLLLPASFKGAAALLILLLPSGLAALVNFPWTISFLMFSHPRFLMFFDTFALPVLGLLYWKFTVRYGAAGAAAVTTGFALLKATILQVVAIQTLKQDHPRDSISIAVPEASLVR